MQSESVCVCRWLCIRTVWRHQRAKKCMGTRKRRPQRRIEEAKGQVKPLTESPKTVKGAPLSIFPPLPASPRLPSPLWPLDSAIIEPPEPPLDRLVLGLLNPRTNPQSTHSLRLYSIQPASPSLPLSLPHHERRLCDWPFRRRYFLRDLIEHCHAATRKVEADIAIWSPPRLVLFSIPAPPLPTTTTHLASTFFLDLFADHTFVYTNTSAKPHTRFSRLCLSVVGHPVAHVHRFRHIR